MTGSSRAVKRSRSTDNLLFDYSDQINVYDEPKQTKKALKGPGTPNQIGSGGRIRTYDLRVMSPTSCQTAPPRTSESAIVVTRPCRGKVWCVFIWGRIRKT